MSRALTALGLNRERYSRDVEAAPSRFDGTDAYAEWAARADETLHWDCDCVPELGPTHCHACSQIAGHPVTWSEAEACGHESIRSVPPEES